MPDVTFYEKRREALKKHYLAVGEPVPQPVQTAGVDHLALICSELERTIRFYTEVLGIRLTRIIQNRDEPTSTHIFFDIGGGNQLAFFDFPEKGPALTIRGVGSMHHFALKTEPHQMRAVLGRLEQRHILYSIHGAPDVGSIYVRDPDNILIELTTGY
jgi:catechol 2,3-dioxygenase-like lactoylglutathione lyase family enzyme